MGYVCIDLTILFSIEANRLFEHGKRAVKLYLHGLLVCMCIDLKSSGLGRVTIFPT